MTRPLTDQAAGAAAPTTVAFMVTCLGDVFYPEVGEKIVRLLRRLNVQVTFPRGQTCCGLPLFNSGYHAAAAAVARRTVALFDGAGPVVVPSGSCAWMVKHEYPGLLTDPGERAAAEGLPVQGAHGGLRLGVGGHLDEREAPRPAGFAVGHDLDLLDLAAVLFEEGT